MDLSIIIPGCNEFPQHAFTVQNVITTLQYTDLKFEIKYIDNMSDKGKPRDYLSGLGKPWLETIYWDEKLSHWCAKNVGIEASTGKILLFMDANCLVDPDAIYNIYKYYTEHYDELNGTLHMPIRYMLDRPGKNLVYKTHYERAKGIVHYSFRTHTEREKIHRVPSMSTCGMMMSREIMVDKLGMWPWEFGIYGGGENFINFTLGVLGYHVNIWPHNPIYHFAWKRGYSWNYDDWVRNRMLAIYMAGGIEWLDTFKDALAAAGKGRPPVLQDIRDSVVDTSSEQQDRIRSIAKYDLHEWALKTHEELPTYFGVWDPE